MGLVTIYLNTILIITLISCIIAIVVYGLDKHNHQRLFPQEQETLRISQNRMTDMLYDFDRVCTENNLTYWIIGGTLLGAVRHGGWIPWDGDMDIAMLIEDYEKFKKLLLINKIPGTFLQDNETDVNYTGGLPKIRDLGSCYHFAKANMKYRHEGFQIDVFLFFRNGDYIRPMHDNPPEVTMKYEDVFPLERVPFEDLMLPIPNNPHFYLKSHYGGNYMEIPKFPPVGPHEGILDPFGTCSHHQVLYPSMHGLCKLKHDDEE